MFQINEIPRALFVILYILLIALSFIFLQERTRSPSRSLPLSTDSLSTLWLSVLLSLSDSLAPSLP